MMNYSSIGDPVAFVESKYGIQLKKVGREEWCGPCIFCGGKDRGRYFVSGRYWCRPGPGHCGRAGWLDEIEGADKPSDLDLLKWRVEALEHKQRDHDRRLSALEQMAGCLDYLDYHANTVKRGEGLDYWFGEGIALDTIRKYELGYCPNCPTFPASASYTVPVKAGGKLFNIRHRLVDASRGGKYRPHRAGLPSMLYNYDDIRRHQERRILVLEGEKKSLLVTQESGIPNVAVMGCASFAKEWAAKFANWQQVVVCLDPDATERAVEIARLFGNRGRVMVLPVKADDFFVRHNGTATEFAGFIADAARV